MEATSAAMATPNPEDTPEGQIKDTPTGVEDIAVTPCESSLSKFASRLNTIVTYIMKGQ